MSTPPNKPTAPRKRAPGGGRKPIDQSGEPLVALNVTVTEAQRDKFKAHLGAAWLRAQIDAATTPPQKP